MLAITAGVIIVGADGGLIKSMQQRWEAILTKAEEEAQNAPSIKDQAKRAAD